MFFIDLRATGSGGIPAEEAAVYRDDGSLSTPQALEQAMSGRDVVLATHGFNVNREHGRHSLAYWAQRCQLPAGYLMVGMLWPGDSAILPVLDYPVEGAAAIKSGKVLANFLNQHAAGAQSVSFVSHSLGARMVLQALSGLARDAHRVILMAGAIEDDCLVREYADAAHKADCVYAIASREDWVLRFAFPIGNPIGEIVMHGHPYFRAAIGRRGPVRLDARTRLWQVPDAWNFGHGDYLPDGPPAIPPLTPPLARPQDGDPAPPEKPLWSAGAVATQVND